MRITFVAFALAALTAAVPLAQECDETQLAQAGVQGDENLCTLSNQMAAAQKEKENYAKEEMKKAKDLIKDAKNSLEKAQKAKAQADAAYVKANGLAGSIEKARAAIAKAE